MKRWWSTKRFAQFCLLVLIATLLPFAMSAARTDGTFVDVSPESDYFDAVEYLADNNLIYGIGEGCFSPDSYITGHDFVAIMLRYAQLDDCYDDNLQQFRTTHNNVYASQEYTRYRLLCSNTDCITWVDLWSLASDMTNFDPEPYWFYDADKEGYIKSSVDLIVFPFSLG